MNYNFKKIINFVEEQLKLSEDFNQIKLRPSQIKLIKNFSKYEEVKIIHSRESGLTTCLSFLIFSLMIKYSNLNIVYMGREWVELMNQVERGIKKYYSKEKKFDLILPEYIKLDNNSALRRDIVSSAYQLEKYLYNRPFDIDVLIIDCSSNDCIFTDLVGDLKTRNFLHAKRLNIPYGIIFAGLPIKNSYFYNYWNQKKVSQRKMVSVDEENLRKLTQQNIENFSMYDFITFHQDFSCEFIDRYSDIVNSNSVFLEGGYRIN